jgi:hypothetical protein
LGGEFFHTEYQHTGCDNELTERCRQIGKYVWAEEARVFHNHPVLHGWKNMDAVYDLVYSKEMVGHDRTLLHERAKKFGFLPRENFSAPRVYPNVHNSIDLRNILMHYRRQHVLNVGIGSGLSGLGSQLPFFRFKHLENIDIHEPYIETAKSLIWDAEKVTFRNIDVRNVNIDEYDSVLMFDVIEHLPKEDAIEILKKIKNGVLFVPIETVFRPNDTDVASQEHLSAWTESDFVDLGFRTKLLPDFHRTHSALWAMKGVV